MCYDTLAKKYSAKKKHRLIDIHTLGAEAGYCSPRPRRSNVAPTQDEHGGHDDSGEHGANHPARLLAIHQHLHLRVCLVELWVWEKAAVGCEL